MSLQWWCHHFYCFLLEQHRCLDGFWPNLSLLSFPHKKLGRFWKPRRFQRQMKTFLALSHLEAKWNDSISNFFLIKQYKIVGGPLKSLKFTLLKAQKSRCWIQCRPATERMSALAQILSVRTLACHGLLLTAIERASSRWEWKQVRKNTLEKISPKKVSKAGWCFP